MSHSNTVSTRSTPPATPLAAAVSPLHLIPGGVGNDSCRLLRFGRSNHEVSARTNLATDLPECARPRAQRRPGVPSEGLRPRTGALQSRGTMRDFIRANLPPNWFGLCLLLTASLVAGRINARATDVGFDARGGQFFGLRTLKAFTRASEANAGEVVFTSREFTPRIPWNELIASWNVDMPKDSFLRIEARAVFPDHATKFYTMSLWSSNPAKYPRECVKGQKDADGDVETDTLVLSREAERFQLRLTMGGDARQLPKIRFLGIHVLDNTSRPVSLTPNQTAWGKTLPVLERSQMAYENGDVICSPTTVSMMLDYWSKKLHRPDLARDVPEVVQGVYDKVWGGTGNWALNMAYAGSFPGMRAYVTRMSDLAELEDWVAQGMPVGLSLCYNRLRGKSREPSGHLVVCVGFTKDGDAVINDPGTSQNVRKVFPRANLVDAWAYSKNAAYIILPEKATPPKDRFGHWDSKTSRQRAE